MDAQLIMQFTFNGDLSDQIAGTSFLTHHGGGVGTSGGTTSFVADRAGNLSAALRLSFSSGLTPPMFEDTMAAATFSFWVRYIGRCGGSYCYHDGILLDFNCFACGEYPSAFRIPVPQAGLTSYTTAGEMAEFALVVVTIEAAQCQHICDVSDKLITRYWLDADGMQTSNTTTTVSFCGDHNRARFNRHTAYSGRQSYQRLIIELDDVRAYRGALSAALVNQIFQVGPL